MVKRLYCYITTNIVLNTDKVITVEQGAGCVIEMDKALTYLPCLKHTEGLPTAMTATNVKYSDIELCIIVLNAINVHVSTAF